MDDTAPVDALPDALPDTTPDALDDDEPPPVVLVVPALPLATLGVAGLEVADEEDEEGTVEALGLFG